MQYVSASQITTYSDCPRKWYLNKIVGLESPSTASTELGSAVHEALENYLRDGTEFPANEVGEIAQTGIEHLPIVRPIEIERSLADMPLKDAPCEVRGFVDVIVPSEHHIIDHKTSSNKRYTKTKRELKQNVQLILYARAYLDHAEDCNEVTLTHIYYGTKSRWSKRVTVKLTRSEIIDQWTSIKQVITEMMKASDADHAGDVTPNYKSCDKYGGCPFAGQCFNASDYTPKEDTMTPQERMRKLGLAEPKTQQAPQKQATQAHQAPQPQNTQTQKLKILYIGCYPIKGTGQPVSALDAFSEQVSAVNEAFKVPHPSLVDFGKGWTALVAEIMKSGWPISPTLYLDPISKEYEHLVSCLSSMADIVIKRL